MQDLFQVCNIRKCSTLENQCDPSYQQKKNHMIISMKGEKKTFNKIHTSSLLTLRKLGIGGLPQLDKEYLQKSTANMILILRKQKTGNQGKDVPPTTTIQYYTGRPN